MRNVVKLPDICSVRLEDELTQSDEFWNGCKSCKNYHILMDNDRERCICTGLVYDNLDDEFAQQAKQNDGKKENE